MLLLTFYVFLTTCVSVSQHEEEGRPLTYLFQRTRSLNGGYATDGDPKINEEVYRIFMLNILDGFNIFKIKMYNDRSFIYLTRRDYWLGDRYYYMDNYYYLATRDSCAYRMNETERQNLFYEEDNMPIFDIIYQCQRYVEYCCGLNCCKTDQIGRHDAPRKPPKYPWQDPWHMSARRSFSMLFYLLILILRM
uniref:CX domain-containing protein n=1 Tax=Caenorhabditis japonica TaxID=281687 RepID=A0A8R1DF66_CAEJA